MRTDVHTADDFAQVLRALPPPGDAWDWPEGGVGDLLLRGTAMELARIDAQVPDVLDAAVAMHTPRASAWRLVDYQRVADASQAGVVAATSHRPFTVGSGAGERLWSAAGSTLDAPLVRVNFAKPFAAGSGAGERLWSARARYILIVRYYLTVADLQALWDALLAFKQAHVYLFFMGLTEVGGEVTYAQN